MSENMSRSKRTASTLDLTGVLLVPKGERRTLFTEHRVRVRHFNIRAIGASLVIVAVAAVLLFW